jgi:hypothetical protein
VPDQEILNIQCGDDDVPLCVETDFFEVECLKHVQQFYIEGGRIAITSHYLILQNVQNIVSDVKIFALKTIKQGI